MEEMTNKPEASGEGAQAQEPIVIQSADGAPLPVTPVGSLGLLAIGYKGIMLWREARHRAGWKPTINRDSTDAKTPKATANDPDAASPEIDPDRS